jgi:hypothetical protein
MHSAPPTFEGRPVLFFRPCFSESRPSSEPCEVLSRAPSGLPVQGSFTRGSAAPWATILPHFAAQKKIKRSEVSGIAVGRMLSTVHRLPA